MKRTTCELLIWKKMMTWTSTHQEAEEVGAKLQARLGKGGPRSLMSWMTWMTWMAMDGDGWLFRSFWRIPMYPSQSWLTRIPWYHQDRSVGPTVKNLMVYAPEVSVYHAKIAQRSLAKVQGKSERAWLLRCFNGALKQVKRRGTR